MIESTTVIVPIRQKTAEAFDAVLDCPMSLLSETKKIGARWGFWHPLEKIKINKGHQNEYTPLVLKDKIRWNIPIEIIPLGDNSEIIFTISKTGRVNEQQFIEKIKEVKISISNLVKIIEKKD